ncbi:non-homologous end joining protein Ku [Kitasatospora griseola]|uniref:non-homologous end joining protein Ku n=1 Tax=Kitasatospora griseola TaxID=2064 RepID=UPI0016712994|nr:Ku protein [Kitasatospora griseola]GGQ89190.1 non-homologous end joining protein Ku [Kitasatospora griseola]
MPQVTWKGVITFGLVSVPVQLYAATEEHSGPALHQVHAKDGSRIRLKRFCEAEEKEVPYSEIAKGYESPDGRQVVLDDEDLAELPLPSKKVVDVLAFVPAESIDPLMFSKAYYVATADKAPAKPYVLLRDALRESGQIAVTKVTMRTRESLAVLRVHEDTLVLQTCLWPDEVRSAQGMAPDEKVTVRPQELKMARSLMDTLSEDFDLSALHDEYQLALQEVIDAKLAGVEAPHLEEQAEGGEAEVIDLMAVLRSSVKAAKGEHGRGTKGGRAAAGSEADAEATDAGASPGDGAAKRTRKAATGRSGAAAKKTAKAPTPAKKSAAKKSAARKAS